MQLGDRLGVWLAVVAAVSGNKHLHDCACTSSRTTDVGSVALVGLEPM